MATKKPIKKKSSPFRKQPLPVASLPVARTLPEGVRQRGNRFQARIGSKTLGMFDTPALASQAYQSALSKTAAPTKRSHPKKTTPHGDEVVRQKIEIDQIVWDDLIVPRNNCDKEVIGEYTEVGRKDENALPPIHVFFDGSTFYGADGRTRWKAAKARNAESVCCEVHHGSRQDATWFASGANRTHGCRMTAADKHKAVLNILNNLALVNLYNQTQIADQVGCSGAFVAKVRASIKPHSGEAKQALAHNVAESEPKPEGESAGDESVPEVSGETSDAPLDESTGETVKSEPRTVTVTSSSGKKFTRKLGANVGRPAGTGQTKAQKAAAKKKVLVDEVDVEVPDWLRDVFIDALAFDAACTQFSKCMESVEKIVGLPSKVGGELDVKHLAAAVQEIRTEILGAKPYAVCEECKARGKTVKSCKCCGKGWYSRPDYSKKVLN